MSARVLVAAVRRLPAAFERHARPRWADAVAPLLLVTVSGFSGCKPTPHEAPSKPATTTSSQRQRPAPVRVQEPRWIDIEPGQLVMGSPEEEPCRLDHEAERTVEIGHGLSMASTEVTQGQFHALMGYDPSFAAACGTQCPVERVSWHEAAAYCNALSKQQQRDPCYRCAGGRETTRCSEAGEAIAECRGYRLPTEAEWEYAARAGSDDAFATGSIESCMTGDDTAEGVAWYKVNSNGTPHPVGQKEANRWGLHDLHGNVSEWVGDWYEAEPTTDKTTDPTGPLRGTERVFRGGDWYHNASHARSAHRERVRPDKRLTYVGFRCVVTR